ncbi:MAG: hypothetical protein ABSB70_18360 [Candidatus Velthaea sp.]|jgi:hypothetical protein
MGDLLGNLGGLASSAGIESSVTDGIETEVIDAVASRVPGGAAIEGLLKPNAAPDAAPAPEDPAPEN